MATKIKRIAVLTSGGDAPGMNAAVRAVVRSGIDMGLEVYGVRDGYKGLVDGAIERMTRKSVSEKIAGGGTFLGTARLPEFRNDETVKEAVENLQEYDIQAVVCVGGDGTYRGGLALEKFGISVVGIPGTIDNDIHGTDFTIGFDTAVNTAVEAVDRLRDTSNSHRRCSVVEVMGRNCGDIAIWVALATGAEFVITKETGYDEKALLNCIERASQTKRHAIVIVAENMIDVNELSNIISTKTEFEARPTILGHVQRGGHPTAKDRVMATLMGVRAVEEIVNGNSGICICERNGKLESVKIKDALLEERTSFNEKYEAFKKLF